MIKPLGETLGSEQVQTSVSEPTDSRVLAALTVQPLICRYGLTVSAAGGSQVSLLRLGTPGNTLRTACVHSDLILASF